MFVLVYIYFNIKQCDFFLLIVCVLVFVNTINCLFFMSNLKNILLFLISNYITVGVLFYYSEYPFINLIFMVTYACVALVLIFFTFIISSLKLLCRNNNKYRFIIYIIIVFIFLMQIFFVVLILLLYENFLTAIYCLFHWVDPLVYDPHLYFEIIAYNNNIILIAFMLLIFSLNFMCISILPENKLELNEEDIE